MKYNRYMMIFSYVLAVGWWLIAVMTLSDPEPSKYKLCYIIAAFLLGLRNFLDALKIDLEGKNNGV